MRARPGSTTLVAVLTLGAGALVSAFAPSSPQNRAVAAPTTTVAAATPTTVATPTTTAIGPTTTGQSAPTTATATTSTEAGPAPRNAVRVAPVVDSEKIRPTELPLRTMAIGTTIVIAGLALVGFFYGRVRSRVPAVAGPQPVAPAPAESPPTEASRPPDAAPATAPAVEMPPPTPLPPPQVTVLPPPEPVNEWAPPEPSVDGDAEAGTDEPDDETPSPPDAHDDSTSVDR